MSQPGKPAWGAGAGGSRHVHMSRFQLLRFYCTVLLLYSGQYVITYEVISLFVFFENTFCFGEKSNPENFAVEK